MDVSSGTGSPGQSRTKGRKTVVCVCVCVLERDSSNACQPKFSLIICGRVEESSPLCACVCPDDNFRTMTFDLDSLGTLVHLDPIHVKFDSKGPRSQDEKSSFLTTQVSKSRGL